MTTMSFDAINEEVDFFRDICGWSDKHIEERLGLADGTLAQRKLRERRRQAIPLG